MRRRWRIRINNGEANMPWTYIQVCASIKARARTWAEPVETVQTLRPPLQTLSRLPQSGEYGEGHKSRMCGCAALVSDKRERVHPESGRQVVRGVLRWEKRPERRRHDPRFGDLADLAADYPRFPSHEAADPLLPRAGQLKSTRLSDVLHNVHAVQCDASHC